MYKFLVLNKKIIFMAAGAALALGLLILLMILIIAGFDFGKLSSVPAKEQKNYTAGSADLKSIIISDTDNSVRIAEGDGDKIEVVYYENSLEYYEINESNGALSIKARNNKKWYDYVGVLNFQVQNTTLLVMVPKDVLEKLDIKTSNGSVTVESVSPARLLNIYTDNGKIAVTNINSQAGIVLTTSNGPLTLENINAAYIKGKTTNGNVKAENIACKTFAGLSSTNAKIDADVIKCGESISLTSTNGRIRVGGLSANEINLKTSNASITGSVSGSIKDYIIRSKTTNADNKLQNLDLGSKKLTVNTSNGKIDISFEN